MKFSHLNLRTLKREKEHVSNINHITKTRDVTEGTIITEVRDTDVNEREGGGGGGKNIAPRILKITQVSKSNVPIFPL